MPTGFAAAAVADADGLAVDGAAAGPHAVATPTAASAWRNRLRESVALVSRSICLPPETDLALDYTRDVVACGQRSGGTAVALPSAMTRAGSIATLAPFVIVLALAVALALAGLFSAPRIASAPTASDAPAPALVAAPSTAAPATGSRANDATEMLRVHNELRVAVGAPPVRA